MRGPAWQDEDTDTFTLDEIGEPTPQVLQAWMADPYVREIVDLFQPMDMKGKDSMRMRDIYKMLEIMGLNRPEFIEVMMASNEDEEEEAASSSKPEESKSEEKVEEEKVEEKKEEAAEEAPAEDDGDAKKKKKKKKKAAK